MFAHGGSSSNTSSRLDSDHSRPSSPVSKSPVKANVYGTTRAPVVSAVGPPPRCTLRRAGIPSADTSACARASVAPGASRPKTTPSGPVLRSVRVGSRPERNPVPEVERELEAVRHDTDDGVHVLAEPQFASDHVSRAGEAPLPDVVADDDDGGGAGRGVGVDDRPADQRRHPRHPKPGGRDLGDRRELDRSVGRNDVALDRLERADVIDRLQAGAPTLEVLPRRVTPPAGLAVPHLDGDNPVTLVERKRTPHDHVERSEHDRGDADRQGHRQPADQRQPPVPDEQPEPEPDIEPRRVEPGQPALIAQRFERLDAAAGGGPGEPRGLARRVALPPELVFSEGQVSGQLALQVIVGPAAD